MTNTKTKLAIASLLAVTLSSSAFAASTVNNWREQNIEQQAQSFYVQTNTTAPVASNRAYDAYAQAPAQVRVQNRNAEHAEFDRATAAALSH